MSTKGVFGFLLLLVHILFASYVEPFNSASSVFEKLQDKGYQLPDTVAFNKAYKSYIYWSKEGVVKKNVMAIADFGKSSNTKRLWVFDFNDNELLFNTWVAHGKYSGEEYASSFSNVSGSKKTSLGAYVTAETYQGSHGYSLKLDGLETGLNDNARSRAVVMHGADYVSADFIRKYGRLGRSFGCPAVSVAESKAIIDALKGGAFLFHYYPK